MKRIKLSDDVRPITDLKNRAAELVDQTRKTHRPVLLTRHGRGVAVLLDVEEYENLTERAAFVQTIEQGTKAVCEGDIHAHDEAVAILESFGK